MKLFGINVTRLGSCKFLTQQLTKREQIFVIFNTEGILAVNIILDDS